MPSPVVICHCFVLLSHRPSNLRFPQHWWRLGVSSLDGLVHSLLERGVAQSTLASYNAGKRRYYNFCAQFGFSPLHLSEVVLCQFVAFLFSESLSYQSIRSYLSAVRHLQITHGLPDPALASFARLDYVLKGVRRTGLPRRRPNRLPITPEILRQIYQFWSREPRQLNRTMLCVGRILSWVFWVHESGGVHLPVTGILQPGNALA